MQIATEISNVDGRYNVQVSTPKFTVTEEELLREYGEPTVDVGGDFSGTLSRAGIVSVAISFPLRSDAYGHVVLNKFGGIQEVVVDNHGTGGDTVSTPVVITGGGTGAVLTASVTEGIVAVTVVNSGYGYSFATVNVAFSMPSELRRIRSDFPVKRIFDLSDDFNSDLKALVWRSTIVTRLTTAKALLKAQSSQEGQTLITV